MGLSVEVARFTSEHAELLTRLAADAFEVVPAFKRPVNLTEAFIKAFHDDRNPAGSSVAAIARIDGRCVGTVAAFPTRFHRASGARAVGYQVSSFAVDHTLQRQGIGKKVLGALTESLRAEPNAFTYTFPNPRSAGVFRFLGYQRVCPIPTYVLPNLRGWGRAPSGGPFSVREPRTGRWECTVFQGSEVGPLLDSFRRAADLPGLIRDRAYLAWRYCNNAVAERYQFLRCRSAAGNGEFIAVLGRHHVNRVAIRIFVDLLSDSPALHLRPMVAAAMRLAGARGMRMAYINTNLGNTRATRGALPCFPRSVAVPDRFNPRPVFLVVGPGDNPSEMDDLRDAPMMTGDWMGF